MEKTNLQETKEQEKRLPEPIKPDKKETAKEFILRNSRLLSDPDILAQEFETKHIPEYTKNKKIGKGMNKRMEKLFMAYGLDTHMPIVDVVHDKYKQLTLQLSRDLTSEFDCQKPSEKILVHLVVNSYIKVIEFSRRFKNYFDSAELDHISNEYYSMLAKEIDRANRQLITALTTLKQLKSPALNITVKADAAFMAEKQLNITNKTNNEINKPK
jgi:hypothetical protein